MRGVGKRHRIATYQALQRAAGDILAPDSPLHAAITAWQSAIVEDLGGRDKVTQAQREVIEKAAFLKIMIDSGIAWFVRRQSAVVYRRRAFMPVVLQLQGLIESQAKLLDRLNLERRQPKAPTLDEYVSQRYGGESEGS